LSSPQNILSVEAEIMECDYVRRNSKVRRTWVGDVMTRLDWQASVPHLTLFRTAPFSITMVITKKSCFNKMQENPIILSFYEVEVYEASYS
jgi:hypothetical protein